MSLGDFLAAYGSVLILPLAVVEGPFVSIVAGFFAAQGYISWAWALTLLILGDLIGDLGYYGIGRLWASPLAGIGRRLGLYRPVPEALQRDLAANAGRMLLIGKWTHSIGCLVLIGSGMLRIPLARFMLFNILGTVPKSALLFGVGYFGGDQFPYLERHGVLFMLALCVAGAAAITLIVSRSAALRSGGADR